jgi:drug/metabolite transporter (DMT)-like permease
VIDERSAAMRRSILGVVLGLAAALAFGAGGTIVKPLFSEGWTPGGAVLARITIAAAVLTIPALFAIRGRWKSLWRARWMILAYAAVAVAGTQLAFYASLERIPVGIALLIEYLAPVALLLLAWARTRRMPHRVVLIGASLAIVGLVLVIGPSGSGGLDPVGVILAGIAMVGVAVYYVMGEKVDAAGIPPVTLAWAGFVVGAIVIALAGLIGVLPVHASFGEVDFFGARAPWWVPLVVVGVVSTAFAYVAGITAITLLGTRVSSFLGLSEVIFAGIVGWIVLGEAFGPVALIGAALILGGIVLVRLEPSAAGSSPLPEAMPITEPGAAVETTTPAPRLH